MFLGPSCIGNCFTEDEPTAFQVARKRAAKSCHVGENQPALDDASFTFPVAEIWNLSFKNCWQTKS